MNAPRKLALQVSGGGSHGRARVGFDQVGHGLGLRQVHAVVQISALREFARARRTQTDGLARLKTALENHLLQSRSPMSLNLENVLARVGGRRLKVKHDRAVDQCAVGFAHGQKIGVTRLECFVGK